MSMIMFSWNGDYGRDKKQMFPLIKGVVAPLNSISVCL